ncbi:hypothetical protein ACHWQZ_G008646 [Mnemiopsis leidyi]
MVRTRRNNSTAATSPTCDHCSSSGHVAAICPRSTYPPESIPSLNCRHCVRYCRSGYRDEPENHQIVMFIDPCSAHSTPVIRPLRPNQPTAAPLNPNPPQRSPPQAATVPDLPPVHPATSTPPALAADPSPPAVDSAPPADDSAPPVADSTPTSDPAPPSTDSTPPSDPAPPAYSPPSDPAPPAYTPADPATVPAPPAYSALNRPPARTFSLCGLINEYDRVVAKVNQQMTLYAALESEGLSPSFFFRKRCVAEAAKVDRPTLESGMNQLRKVTLKGVFPIAKDICNRRLNDLRTLATSGAVLQPKGRY